MSILSNFFKGSSESVPTRILRSSSKKVQKTDNNNNQIVISSSQEMTEWRIYDGKIEIKKDNYPAIVLDTLTENEISHPPQLMIYRVYEPSAIRSGISLIMIASPIVINVTKYLEDRTEIYNIIYDSLR